MKNYLDLIEKKSDFISNFVKSYDNLIKTQKTKNNYNNLINNHQKNQKINTKEVFNNFYLHLKKNDEAYNGYKISCEETDEKIKKKETNYIINIPNFKYKNEAFEIVEMKFSLIKNETVINSISLTKYLNKENIIINVDITKELIEIHIKSTNKKGFGLAKLSFFNNKINKGELIEELPETGSFKECLSFFNRINDLGYREEVIDFLILNKDFTEEELNLYLIAYDLDLKKEFKSPLRVNFKEKNGMFIINKKCYNNLK